MSTKDDASQTGETKTSSNKSKEMAGKLGGALKRGIVSGATTVVEEAREHITVENVKNALPEKEVLKKPLVWAVLVALGFALNSQPNLLLITAVVFIGMVYVGSKLSAKSERKTTKTSKTRKPADTQNSDDASDSPESNS